MSSSLPGRGQRTFEAYRRPRGQGYVQKRSINSDDCREDARQAEPTHVPPSSDRSYQSGSYIEIRNRQCAIQPATILSTDPSGCLFYSFTMDLPERQSQCSFDSVEPRRARVHHATTTPWIHAYLMARLAMAVNTARYSDG